MVQRYGLPMEESIEYGPPMVQGYAQPVADTRSPSRRLRPRRASCRACHRSAQNLADDLARLAALHRTGELTDTEYADAKARVLHPSVGSY